MEPATGEDDMKITHTRSKVIQYNEYYPFGMQTTNSWTRENVTGNNFSYNAGTELNTTSNLYDLDYRQYDPVLGRLNGIDPMATKYASLSPYNFSFNDPVTFSDPSGADPNQRSDDTWWVSSRTSLYGSRYAGFSSAGELAFQNPAVNLSTNPWAWTAMDPYGDMSGPNMFGSGFTPGAFDGTFRMAQEGWLPEFTTKYTEYSDGTIRVNSVRLTGFVKKAHRQQQTQERLFNSMDDAAKDWAMKYNDNSIVDNREYGSSIYKIGDKYTYSIPNVGSSIRVDVSAPPPGYKAVAFIHSHGKYDSRYKKDELVGHDTDQSDKNNLTIYAAVPAGILLRYDPFITVRDNWVDVLIPSDQGDPFHVNSVDARNGPKNEPSTSSFWNKFYHFWDD